ncbi:MAG: cytochrome b/b6 domain-containing protein [Gammaproteobacteria bacterium]|nr:cytochrome b/b6 domain-containing protein [Gammaproteobacteria bacterium]MCP5426070.1 cytochrome b/b6 domain-containing protein [Gammaproteobacteria bacterium]
MNPTNELDRIPIWDLPVRLFHWLVVTLFIVSFVTGQIGGNAMIYHMYSGYSILALVIFRVLWGFFGSTSARFSHFVRGPAAFFSYAKTLPRRVPSYTPGHNPVGGGMVVVLLALLLVQAVTGLFANDDIFIEGPLAGWVSKETSDWLTGIHEINIDLLLILVGLHVAAVLFYLLYKRENLVEPMVTGNKRVAGEPKTSIVFPSLWRALLLALLAAGGVLVLVGAG